jgi:peptidoglycan hydrolase-like protein with peptidoglycan-binding domain
MMLPRSRRSVLVPVLGLALAASACTFPTDQERAKAAEESAKKSLVAIDHLALEQKVDPEQLKKIQQQLAAVNEYMGPPNGKLDQVTVNAYEAFQRRNDFFPDGLFTEKQLHLLEEAAAKHGAGAKG